MSTRKYKDPTEGHRRASAAYYSRNRELVKERMRKAIQIRTWSKLGLSFNDVFMMRHNQNSLCKICKKETGLVVDHDHKTGRVRGMICNRCNGALGWFELRMPEIFEYLQLKF